MLATLGAWSARCVATLAELEGQIAAVKAEAARRHRGEEEESATLNRLLKEKVEKGRSGQAGDVFSQLNRKLGAGAASKRGNGGLERDGGDDMDIDDEDEEIQERRETRSSKKRGFGNMGFGK